MYNIRRHVFETKINFNLFFGKHNLPPILEKVSGVKLLVSIPDKYIKFGPKKSKTLCQRISVTFPQLSLGLDLGISCHMEEVGGRGHLGIVLYTCPPVHPGSAPEHS
jgi:hypothetical protein